MKKIIIFLILIIAVTCQIKIDVQAETQRFYEAEYIEGIWMNKSPKKGSNVIYYQTARFFRKGGTGEFAYCIEPFQFFDGSKTYEPTINPSNLTNEQKERISMIAHFGYGYKSHTEKKWYAITQFMIWEIADPTGDYYFTDSLNGQRITRFTEEMEEINQLVSSYKTLPNIANQTYAAVEDNKLTLIDSNNILSNYTTTNPNAKIQDNTLIIENLKEGLHTITLEKEDKFYNKPIIFYQAEASQNLIDIGDLSPLSTSLNVEVKKTSITITKIDSTTKTIKASGDASLIGAIYQLYDQNMNKITTLTIDETYQANINNLPYGKYYLQEIQAGEGYKIDKTIYNIEITKDNTNIDLILENQVIKKKIHLKKVYGTPQEWHKEPNVRFNVYNKTNELVATMITNEEGEAEIELPYGNYVIKQITSTPGYETIEDIHLTIIDENPISYHLSDYKIKIPYTKTTWNNLFNYLITLIRKILCTIK